VLRPAPGVTLQRQELFDYVRNSIAPHKTPRDWFVVNEFPLTGSGKIQKFKLQKMSADGELTLLD
ncbi:MAG: AMP-dependent synthetase, partial [Actinomycetota bacterium]|nr:AMP-dependent synthetase [Actinomycetota bacterium]